MSCYPPPPYEHAALVGGVEPRSRHTGCVYDARNDVFCLCRGYRRIGCHSTECVMHVVACQRPTLDGDLLYSPFPSAMGSPILNPWACLLWLWPCLSVVVVGLCPCRCRNALRFRHPGRDWHCTRGCRSPAPGEGVPRVRGGLSASASPEYLPGSGQPLLPDSGCCELKKLCHN